MARAWEEWGSGYGVEPSEVLKTFEDGANGYDEMILERDIPFVSHCEHHMAQFRGTVDIAYVPDKRIVGLSKLTRLVEVFARRLQVQERMTTQLADALVEGLNPKGVGVIIKASHSCIESRGVRSHGQSTITCAVRGVIKDKPEARAEFLAHTR
jgi:GTP cyclohydrolase I